MNKKDLAKVILEHLGEDATKKQAEELVETVFDTMSKEIKSGEEVKIAGFGAFKIRHRPARMARNPATGEQVHVAAKSVLKFRPAKELKEAVK
jgi:nucleoid DNA-binding protein